MHFAYRYVCVQTQDPHTAMQYIYAQQLTQMHTNSAFQQSISINLKSHTLANYTGIPSTVAANSYAIIYITCIPTADNTKLATATTNTKPGSTATTHTTPCTDNAAVTCATTSTVVKKQLPQAYIVQPRTPPTRTPFPPYILHEQQPLRPANMHVQNHAKPPFPHAKEQEPNFQQPQLPQ